MPVESNSYFAFFATLRAALRALPLAPFLTGFSAALVAFLMALAFFFFTPAFLTAFRAICFAVFFAFFLDNFFAMMYLSSLRIGVKYNVYTLDSQMMYVYR